MASLTFQNLFIFSGVWKPPDPIQFKCCIHISEILECLEIHMSGSQACGDSPHGPIEKEMCYLKAEKNESFWLLTEPDTISLFCLLMYMYFLFIRLPHFVLITCILSSTAIATLFFISHHF